MGTGFFVGDALAQALNVVKDGSNKEVQQKFDITLMDVNGIALEGAQPVKQKSHRL